MNLRSLLLGVGALLVLVAGNAWAGRTLLPRPVYYSTGTTVSDVKFWAMYLGNFELDLVRKFPGEDEKPIKTSMNLNLVSSGYVEGTGYSSKGKINCNNVSLLIGLGDEARKITVDSIDYVYDYGSMVVLRSGAKGEFTIDVEGIQVAPKGLKLRLYEMTKQYGEEILKEKEGDLIAINCFSFTKEGAQRALKQPAAATK